MDNRELLLEPMSIHKINKYFRIVAHIHNFHSKDCTLLSNSLKEMDKVKKQTIGVVQLQIITLAYLGT